MADCCAQSMADEPIVAARAIAAITNGRKVMGRILKVLNRSGRPSFWTACRFLSITGRQTEGDIIARVIASADGNNDILLAGKAVRHGRAALWRGHPDGAH